MFIRNAAMLLVMAAAGTMLGQNGGPAGLPAGGPNGSGPTAAPGMGARRSAGLNRQVRLGALPKATAAMIKAHPSILRPQNNATDAQWNSRKDRANKRGGPSMVRPSPTGSPAAPQASLGAVRQAGVQTPGTSTGFFGLGEAGLTPSDMGLAVGPNFVLQLVNAQVGVFDKSGNLFPGYPVSLNSFLGLDPSAFTFDPRALYDILNDRYIVVIDQADFANSQGFFWIAASQSGDPTAGWNLYQIQMGSAGTCPDFPTVGQDRQGIYVSGNKFGCNSGGFFGGLAGNEVWLLPKSAIYAGNAFTFWIQTGLNVNGVLVDTIQPANVFSPYDSPRAEFMVNSFNINFGGGQCLNGCSGLVVWAVSNQFGFLNGGPNPEFTGMVIPTNQSYYLSLGVHQPGANFSIDAGDTRVSATVPYIAGSLFGSLTTAVLGSGPPEQSSVYWFEIGDLTLNDNDPQCGGAFTNACPQLTSATVLQQNCYFCGAWEPGGSAYYGALQPDLEKNVTMVFNWSSSTTYPGTAYVSRRVTQAQNSMHDAGNFLQTGNGQYTQGRWGDYEATSLDISNPSTPTMWFSGMYSVSPGWGTVIGANGFTDPTQP